MGIWQNLKDKVQNLLFKKIWIPLKKLFIPFWNWLKQTTLEINDDYKNNQNSFNKRFLFVLCAFIVSFLLVWNYFALPEIIKLNFSKTMQTHLSYIFIISVIISFVLWLYVQVALDSRKYNIYFLFIIILFAMTKFSNIIISILGNIAILVLIFTYPYVLRKDWKESSFWGIFTLLLMLVGFTFGSIYLSGAYGLEGFSLHLNIDGDTSNRYGEIKCESEYPVIAMGERAECELTKSFNIDKGKIIFFYPNKTLNENLTDLKFEAPYNSSAVKIEIHGKTDKNKFLNLTTYHPYEFVSTEERNNTYRTFLKEFLAMIGVVLFSIPTMMASLKKLWKKSL